MMHRGSLIIRAIEMIRIATMMAGFYWIYDRQALGLEIEALRFLVLTLALSLCGTCALEGVFFSESSAREKGYRVEGERKSPYQIQNLARFWIWYGLFRSPSTRYPFSRALDSEKKTPSSAQVPHKERARVSTRKRSASISRPSACRS